MNISPRWFSQPKVLFRITIRSISEQIDGRLIPRPAICGTNQSGQYSYQRLTLPCTYLNTEMTSKGVVINYGREGGGYKTGGGGGHVTSYPYKKGGGRNSFSHPEGWGGGTNSFAVLFTRVIEVLTILEGGTQKVCTL